MTGDGFFNHGQSDVIDNYDNYKASLNLAEGELRPVEFRRFLSLFYDSDASTNTIRMGDMIMPKYTESVLIDQSVASQSENVNQFELVRYVGEAKLNPKADMWTVRRILDSKTNKTTEVVENGDYSTYDTFVEYGTE